MKLITNGINGEYIPLPPKNIDGVKAAIAYATGRGNVNIFNFCFENNVPITFYGRYDHTVPIATDILKKFLNRRSPDFVCKLVERFHPKVILWEGFGAYIGSANHTYNGLETNIETGVLFTNDELIEYGLDTELEDFFCQIDKYSHPLTDEIYEHLCKIKKERSDLYAQEDKLKKEFDKTRKMPKLRSVATSHRPDKKAMALKKKNDFLNEWNATLQIVRDIGHRVSKNKYRPVWVDATIKIGVQADQFLHAHYYEKTIIGNRSHHNEQFEQNKNSSEKALVSAMNWWHQLSSSPHNEESTMNRWAPFLNEKLAKEQLLDLSLNEFVDVCSHVHAIIEHSRQIRKQTLSIPEGTPQMLKKDRVKVFAKWLYDKKSEDGKSPLEVTYYVLYGGTDADLPSRLWDAVNDKKWRIAHFGLSSLGEIVGWALPDKFPPRNGRTSKALKALGYDVKIHTE